MGRLLEPDRPAWKHGFPLDLRSPPLKKRRTYGFPLLTSPPLCRTSFGAREGIPEQLPEILADSRDRSLGPAKFHRRAVQHSLRIDAADDDDWRLSVCVKMALWLC